MTWVTVTDWNKYGIRWRRGPDGTMAKWERAQGQYKLTHYLPNGLVVGPVQETLANAAREAMSAERPRLGLRNKSS